MEDHFVLRQYEYSIPASPLAPSTTTRRINSRRDNHPSLIKVTIDFEIGHLLIESDWQTLLASNKYNEPAYGNRYKGKAYIEASLKPAFPVNLLGDAHDGLAMTLDGNIEYGGQSSGCTGLLVLEKNELADQWTVWMYLYDVEFPDWEIQLTIPVYVNFFYEYNSD